MAKQEEHDEMAEKTSLGFDILEGLIEREELAYANRMLHSTYCRIKERLKSEKAADAKENLENVAMAYEHVADLMCHLLNIKFELDSRRKEAQAQTTEETEKK